MGPLQRLARIQLEKHTPYINGFCSMRSHSRDAILESRMWRVNLLTSAGKLKHKIQN